MALKLYRRHRKECEGAHPEDARTGEFEEGRRGWKKCGCLIHVSGTLGGKFNRKQTGKADWDEAKALVALWEKAGSWDGQDKIEQPLPPTAEAAPGRITIARAIKAFTTEFQEYAAPATQKKYRRILKRFQAFSDAKGYAAIDQWNPLDVREFRSSWPVSPRTAARSMSMVKAFFEFCLYERMDAAQPGPHGQEPAQPRYRRPSQRTEIAVHRRGIAPHVRRLRNQVRQAGRCMDARDRRPAHGCQLRPLQPRMDRAGRGGLYFGVGLYRPAHLRRVPVSHRPHGGGRRDPAQNDEGRNACLHLGSRMVAGAHTRPAPAKSAPIFSASIRPRRSTLSPRHGGAG